MLITAPIASPARESSIYMTYLLAIVCFLDTGSVTENLYPAPQDEKRSCKKVYPQITSQRRRNGDAARKAYRNTQSKLIHRRTANPDIEKYRQNVDDLQKKYKEKKEAVDNGTMSLKEFKDWLNSY
jgi:hypothetical protein